MEVMQVLLLLLITLASFCIWKHVRKFRFLEELGFPHPPPHLVFGNVQDLPLGSLQTAETFAKWKKRYGDVFGYYTGTLPTLVVTDLDLLKKVAIQDANNFINRHFFTNEFQILKKSLSGLKGNEWRVARRVITPALSPAKIKQIYQIIASCIAEFDHCLTGLLDDGNEINIQDRFLRLSLDIIGQTIFATNIKCQREHDNKFLKNFTDLINHTASTKIHAIQNNLPKMTFLYQFISKFHPMHQKIVHMDNHIHKVVTMRRNLNCEKQKSKAAAVPVDMLQLILEAVTSHSNEAPKCTAIKTNNDIADNILLFLIGGTDTTSLTLSYIAYLLARHADVQDKLHQEIIDNVKDLSNVTFDDLGNLPYMEQVMNETLRIYPPIWCTNRECLKDYDYNGRTIPKGMKIDIPIYTIHHDPDIWPDPETFDPERFSAENRAKIHPVAHIPFGLGPRNCIGMRLAMIDIKATLVTFLSKYKLEPPTTDNGTLELSIPVITLCPKHEIIVKLTPRNL